MNITSELQFTNVSVDIPKFSQNFYKDTYSELYHEDLKYINIAKTRYNDVFYYYNTDSIIGVSLKYYGEYTEHELNLLNQLIQPGFVVYDIGANIGYHTVGFAERAKRVYAFEPNELNYKLLQKNTFFKPNVTLLDVALSNSVGTTQIEKFELGVPGNYGECKIVDDGQTCEMTTVDTLVKSGKIQPPNLVKIDVEGHEWCVIDGMRDTIENNLPIIFYEHMHGDDLPNVHEYLESKGYEIYWFPCMNYNPNNFLRNKQNIFGNGGVMNALALPFFIQAKTNLLKKISADDTWEKTIERYQQQNAKGN